MLQPHGEDYWNIVLVVADSITYALYILQDAECSTYVLPLRDS